MLRLLMLLRDSKGESEKAARAFELQEQITERDQITAFKEGLSTRLGDVCHRTDTRSANCRQNTNPTVATHTWYDPLIF